MTDHPPPNPGRPGWGSPGQPSPYLPVNPAPPPSGRANRSVLIALIVAVVVVVVGIGAAVVLTGGDDTTVQGASGSPTPSTSASTDSGSSAGPSPTSGSGSSAAPSTTGPTASSTASLTTTATATGAGNIYFQAFKDHSLTSLKKLACPSSSITLTQATVDAVDSAVSDGPAEESDNTATMTGTLKANDGSSAKVTLLLTRESGSWCLDHTKAS